MKKMFLSCLAVLAFATTQAQVQKTFHQTFDVSGAENIQVSLADNYEILPWAGNSVMIETTVKLSNVGQNVLDYIVNQEGRYNIKMLTPQENTVQLISKNPIRKAINVKGVDCEEIVVLKIFVPDTFNVDDRTQFTLIKSGNESSNK